jgi:hypothetical protein
MGRTRRRLSLLPKSQCFETFRARQESHRRESFFQRATAGVESIGSLPDFNAVNRPDRMHFAVVVRGLYRAVEIGHHKIAAAEDFSAPIQTIVTKIRHQHVSMSRFRENCPVWR